MAKRNEPKFITVKLKIPMKTAAEWWADKAGHQPKTQDEMNQVEMLRQFGVFVLNDPCTCETDNYGYGFAKCYDCGRLKEVAK